MSLRLHHEVTLKSERQFKATTQLYQNSTTVEFKGLPQTSGVVVYVTDWQVDVQPSHNANKQKSGGKKNGRVKMTRK